MPPLDLSPEQEAVLDPDVRVIEAGPGSGKTRALIARFLLSASTSKRGVALLSFTNAAVDEVRRRSAQTPHLLQAPHFVGTIDSFLHRFIVTPTEVVRLRHVPTYCQSWDELSSNISEVRINGVRGAGVSLSSFGLDQAGDVVINETGLAWPERTYLASVDAAGRRPQLLTMARSRIRGLMRNGIYDPNTARFRAFGILQSGAGQAIVDRLALRFAELLIDEAQDCDDAEMGVIRRVSLAMPVTVVADPDQAIYEFRGSRPELFQAYRDEQAAHSRRQLTVNYRSTDAICRAVTSLRAAGGAPIEASNKEPCSTVLVLNGTLGEQRDKFMTALAGLGIDRSEAMVLAHGMADARALGGGRSLDLGTAAVGNRLALLCAVLRDEPSPSRRLEAVRQLERIILSLMEWPDDMHNAGRQRQLELLDRPAQWLRQVAGACVSSLSQVDALDNFGPEARRVLAGLLGVTGSP